MPNLDSLQDDKVSVVLFCSRTWLQKRSFSAVCEISLRLKKKCSDGTDNAFTNIWTLTDLD